MSRALNKEDRVLAQLSSLILTVSDNFDPVTYFNEDTCSFQELYIETVRETTFQERLPWSAMQNLKRLGLSNVSKTEVLKPIKQLTFLESLILTACTFDQSDLNILADIAIHCKLTHLDISANRGISGKLSILLDHTYPSLDTLVLSNCVLTEQDLESLTLASVGGRLPKLKHLDISGNQLWRHAKRFFSNDCKWDHLISLDVTDDTKDTNISGFIVQLSKHLSSSSLQSLQELTFTDNQERWSIMAKCEHLQTLRVKKFNSRCMATIVSALHNGMLPALRNFMSFQEDIEGYEVVRLSYESVRILTKYGVFCHDTVPSTNPFTRSCRLCRHTQV